MSGIIKVKKDKKGLYAEISKQLKKRKVVEFVYGKPNEIYKKVNQLLNQGYVLV